MQRFMLKSMINEATLTGAQLHYDGSIAIDRLVLEAVDILPGEQVHVLNMNNGSRIITYAIEAPPGSGEMMLNGAAARVGLPGDKVIVLAYCAVSEEEPPYATKIVKLDDENRLPDSS